MSVCLTELPAEKEGNGPRETRNIVNTLVDPEDSIRTGI